MSDIEKRRGAGLGDYNVRALIQTHFTLQPHQAWMLEALDTALTAAREEGRREGFEKAREMAADLAKRETEHSCNPYAQCTCDWRERLRNLPADIRAMWDGRGDDKTKDARQTCTCTGSCKGAAGLGLGWRCALETTP